MLPALKETLDRVQLPRRRRPAEKLLLTAADLGCACGLNTLVIADTIVQHMTRMCGASCSTEFCFYFSDLPGNDFNTLFQLLSQHAAAAAGYFAAAVPGSFHDRLFPERSINVFTSTFCLQWLSQVPEGVADKQSPAYNKGKVFVHGASDATGAAYRWQFHSDMARFLRCRAAELSSGGAMFLVCLGRPSSVSSTDQGGAQLLYGAMFEDAWNDLVDGEVIDGEKMDGFNVPAYAATLEEFREAVDADGSFEINRLELAMGNPIVADGPDGPRAVGRTVANYVRSLLGPLVVAHVGGAVADELFVRMQGHAEARAQELVEKMRFPHIVCSLTLA
uniref:Jasmonate O-methyltransferase n=1 Tax=Oryza brachyantha TaxID=4533 RepID=J3M2E7_ORYBR